MSESPAILRQRAAALRQRANAIARASVFQLPQRAGDDVWIGPTASRFREDLSSVLVKVRAASTELQQAAARLERRADATEVALRATVPH